MFYYDFTHERCVIDTDYDLQTALGFTKNAKPPILKLCLNIARNIADQDDKYVGVYNRTKTEYKDTDYLSDDSDNEEYEKFYLLDFELDYDYIIRDGYIYKHGSPYNKTHPSKTMGCMYHCVDAF